MPALCRTTIMLVPLVVLGAFVLVTPSEREPDGVSHVTQEGERARIRQHLADAERMMRASDVVDLSAEQRAKRAYAIHLLRTYRERGVFPHNHESQGQRVPSFVDSHGTLCAMAHLIASTGGQALVRKVQEAANHAYVRDLAANPAFLSWLERNGMTIAEAARVQPAYDYTPADRDIDEHYAFGTALVTGAEGLAIGLQLSGDASLWENLLGLGAGLGGILVGFNRVGHPGADATMARMNLAFGGLTAGFSVWNLLSDDDSDAPDSGLGGEGDVVVSPIFAPAALGLALRITF